jgi:hypothetical protein
MLSDSTPFVRQGAYIAIGLIMIQQSNKHPKVHGYSPPAFTRWSAHGHLDVLRAILDNTYSLSQSDSVRKALAKAIGDKTEDVLTKVGAIYAQGIIDAGQPPHQQPLPCEDISVFLQDILKHTLC